MATSRNWPWPLRRAAWTAEAERDPRRASRRSRRRDDTAHALRDDVEGGPLRVRADPGPRIAEAADGGVDETRVPLAEALPPDAEAIHHPDPGVLDDRIRP